MKELSIEEKAKRYDETLERANSLLSGNQLGNAWIYKLLPELKESEDERIRQFLIHEVTETSDKIMSYHNMNKKDVLAWLEKQKHEEWSLYDEKILSEIFTSVEIDAYSEEKKKEIISWLQKYRPYMREKQGEQEQDVNIQINPSEYINDMGGNGCYLKNTAQKPANTVEPRFKINDKVIHKETGKIWTIHWYLADTNSYYVIDEEELIHHYGEDVLESAEQKPADKCEGCNNAKGCVAWLKSLKERYTWKPSNEQMDAISWALSLAKNCGEEYAFELGQIQEQLKKLREE